LVESSADVAGQPHRTHTVFLTNSQAEIIIQEGVRGEKKKRKRSKKRKKKLINSGLSIC
jgi:hypothetical protein